MTNNQSKYYFISDVHLGFYERSIDKHQEELLINSLDLISRDAKGIFLLGDIFDYWFEWRRVIPRHHYRTLSKLYDLKHSGIEISYLMGNHDFGHKDFFSQELGITVYPNELVTELEGKKFFLHHGDGLAEGDSGYKILKKITRNKCNQRLYTTLLHPNFAIKLASTSSSKSRKYTDKKDYGKTDGMAEYAKNKIDEGFDFVVMGHRHKREILPHNKGIYVNLGAWFDLPEIGVFDGNEFSFIDVKNSD